MNHVTDKIQAYVAGELSGADAQSVTEHLTTCPQCAGEVEEARLLWAALGEVATSVELTNVSAWPEIQARTFGFERDPVLYGGGLWSKTGIAAVALAAGLSLAVLLPTGSPQDTTVASEDETLGSSFWLSEQSDTAFTELWLAVADEGSGS